MVIQRNKKGGVKTFNKKWKDYEEGFGDLNGDKLWYGLKALNCFTENGQWELRIDFQFINNTWSHLHYKQFKVGNTSAEYPLTIGGFTGAEDPFAYPSLIRMRFSTFDNDNDPRSNFNCASGNRGGWWHGDIVCYHINPNIEPPYVYLSRQNHDLLSMEMKIRPHKC